MGLYFSDPPMSSYPNSIASPRTVENKSGVVYDAEKTKIVYAEDMNGANVEIVAIETELGTLPKGSDASVKARLDRIDADKIEAVVDDTTPQLGGELDTNSHPIHINNSPADHIGTGLKTHHVAGETIVLYNVCKRKSDAKIWKAKADAIANASAFCLALEGASAEADCDVLLTGIARDDSWSWTVGGLIYLDASTYGAMTQTAPSGANNVIQILGIALSATRIFFNPQLVQVEHA